jgi:hypothetical protein
MMARAVAADRLYMEIYLWESLTAASACDVRVRFEIEVGKTSIGADISAFSQFEGEKEYLFAPLTHLQLVGTPHVDDSLGQDRKVSVLRMRLTVNQRIQTIKQIERTRLDGLEYLSASLEWEVSLAFYERDFVVHELSFSVVYACAYSPRQD